MSNLSPSCSTSVIVSNPIIDKNNKNKNIPSDSFTNYTDILRKEPVNPDQVRLSFHNSHTNTSCKNGNTTHHHRTSTTNNNHNTKKEKMMKPKLLSHRRRQQQPQERPASLIADTQQNSSNSSSPSTTMLAAARNKKRSFCSSWSVVTTPDLPFCYPLQNTHTVISSSDMNPSDIASNIEQCLRQLSILVEFNNEKASAHCTTMDFIKFNIHLYKSATDNISSENGNYENSSTIVEVHRLSSTSSLKFYRMMISILKSARGEFTTTKHTQDEDDVEELRRRKRMRLNTNNMSSDCITDTAIENARILICKDRHDARKLGMESLVMLSSLEYSDEHTALMTSKTILSSSHDVNRSVLSRTVYNLIRYGRDDIIHDDDEEERDGDGLDPFLEEHYKLMRNDALVILHNCLETLNNNISHNNTLSYSTSWFLQHDFIHTLIQDLNSPSKNPQDAYLSAKVLLQLMKATTSTSSREREQQQDCLSFLSSSSSSSMLQDAASISINFGTQHCELLEKACLKLLHVK